MAQYAIGDLQGCFKPFTQLLDMVNFNSSKDHLYLVGDVIARGPDSLACLDWLYMHQDSITITLGNHDLHLLACAELNRRPNPKDKLENVFQSPRFSKYLSLLKQQPLAIFLPEHRTFISHAGIHPTWSINTALEYAQYVEQRYRGHSAKDLFSSMYSEHPTECINALSEAEKFRAIINVFTRMRYLTADNELDLTNKGGVGSSSTLTPWFHRERFQKSKTSFIFGHWAALKGVTKMQNVIALDTGCVWGGPMTMMNIATKEQYLSK
ncbi:bis(5'-nucleosyl)-tetraphosphatase (symmetrical) [Pseudoalteromonas sp. MSK9-3]|uniref:symmetrical bis(5'-nucleosyl)-tetraphosphatase n=1 Tax=Pseudoalteromonas sp. MSK9-3 TaxID=1897633 RepID=UPI000E6C851D|nr:symmetrical bis(5'-nucleosyl)-tetraphosphatase [Pseudoalteromonas sp. MSK9-3]RJE75661.1 bis(5'-nucleosyl)-tetraphosphatase (symmetrical) [Pseudoalteromonas sp. MSK9-3]